MEIKDIGQYSMQYPMQQALFAHLQFETIESKLAINYLKELIKLHLEITDVMGTGESFIANKKMTHSNYLTLSNYMIAKNLAETRKIKLVFNQINTNFGKLRYFKNKFAGVDKALVTTLIRELSLKTKMTGKLSAPSKIEELLQMISKVNLLLSVKLRNEGKGFDRF